MEGPARESYQTESSPSDASAAAEAAYGSGIRYGTVGWENAPSRVVLGQSGTPDQGITLVRVTLYDGKQIGPSPKSALAQGHEIVAHILGLTFDVPPSGTRVAVAFPEGPQGPGLILGPVGPSPAQQFSDTRTVLARANLTLGDPSGNGTVEISPTGIVLGHGATDAPSLASIVDSIFSALSTLETAASTCVTALNTYAVAIQAVADPSNLATPTLTAAITAFKVAITTFQSAIMTTKSTFTKTR